MNLRIYLVCTASAGLALSSVSARADVDVVHTWVAAGLDGAPCGLPSSCALDKGYGCVDGFCTATGQLDQTCRPWGHPFGTDCDESLVCSDSRFCVEPPPVSETYTPMSSLDLYSNPGSHSQLLSMGAAFARLSQVVYKESDVRNEILPHFEMTERSFIEGSGDTQAWIVEDNSAVIVVVRGSHEPFDWFVDAGVVSTPMPLYGRVHLGFSLAANAVFEDVRNAIDESTQDNGNRRLFLTGHSLGGAVALLLTAMLEAEGYEIAGVTTFGSPAAGDSVWRDSYNGRFGSVTQRWLNAEDLIPCLPPSSFWKHVGNQHYLFDGTVDFYDHTDHCYNFPNLVLNPLGSACGQESKIVEYLRRAFTDPFGIICIAPDHGDALISIIIDGARGRNTDDHAIAKYATALESHL